MDFPIYSPLQQIEIQLLEKKKLKLWVKRDDLIHPTISGNKFRKLKYNLIKAEEEGEKTILTFGGAYSNHIAATAYAGKLFGFKTIGIIRGEEPAKWSQTLIKAKQDGMLLKFIARGKYKKKEENGFVHGLRNEFGDFFWIPEGGANELGVKGCSEILDEVQQKVDYIGVACGTGTTLAGIASSLGERQKVLGFPALKGGGFLWDDIKYLLGKNFPKGQVDLFTDFHFGGYAKITPELVDFTNWFYRESRVPLDLVYTAKLFYGIFELVKQDYFPQGSTILAIHTGGLQGNIGMLQRHKIKLDFC